jgi:wee1-like protein kinase
MESEREIKIGECRKILAGIGRCETPRKELIVDTQGSTCIKRWHCRDKLFNGKFSSSGASTPLSPQTPTVVSQGMRYQASTVVKERMFQPWSKQETFNIRGLNFNDDSLQHFSPPVLSAQNSTLLFESTFADEPIPLSRYEEDFEELEAIGIGSSGTVYKCKHRYDSLYYAVKQIKISVSCPQTKKEGLREATTLARSSMADDNFYIIRYFSVWIEEDFLYISMELCDCSLLEYIERQGEVSEELVKQVMRDLCKGLSKLHRKNIVHLDIKTENVLFSFSHRFKLGDLGLAQLTTDLNLDKEITEGDSRYLAPEMLDIIDDDAETIPDLTKADMFSLGATVYEIMRGKELPKNGEEWHHIRSDALSIEGPYSDELKAVVRSLLSRNPVRRPSAQELLDSFLMSATRQELKRLKMRNEHLESQLAERRATLPGPCKKRRVEG